MDKCVWRNKRINAWEALARPYTIRLHRRLNSFWQNGNGYVTPFSTPYTFIFYMYKYRLFSFAALAREVDDIVVVKLPLPSLSVLSSLPPPTLCFSAFHRYHFSQQIVHRMHAFSKWMAWPSMQSSLFPFLRNLLPYCTDNGNGIDTMIKCLH